MWETLLRRQIQANRTSKCLTTVRSIFRHFFNYIASLPWIGGFRTLKSSLSLIQYIQFVMDCIGLSLAGEDSVRSTAQVFVDLMEGAKDLNTEICCLQAFVDVYHLFLKIIVIDQDRTEEKLLDGSTNSEPAELMVAIVVLGKDHRKYFPLFKMDKNNVEHRIFCSSDACIAGRYKDLVKLDNPSRKFNISRT